MEDPFSDGVEVRTPEGFSSGREKCLSGDGSFILQGTDFYPSPVSVLDSPMYQEEFQLEELIASPGSVKSSMAKHAGMLAFNLPHALRVRSLELKALQISSTVLVRAPCS